jgi:hypothetical protein
MSHHCPLNVFLVASTPSTLASATKLIPRCSDMHVHMIRDYEADRLHDVAAPIDLAVVSVLNRPLCIKADDVHEDGRGNHGRRWDSIARPPIGAINPQHGFGTAMVAGATGSKLEMEVPVPLGFIPHPWHA